MSCILIYYPSSLLSSTYLPSIIFLLPFIYNLSPIYQFISSLLTIIFYHLSVNIYHLLSIIYLPIYLLSIYNQSTHPLVINYLPIIFLSIYVSIICQSTFIIYLLLYLSSIIFISYQPSFIIYHVCIYLHHQLSSIYLSSSHLPSIYFIYYLSHVFSSVVKNRLCSGACGLDCQRMWFPPSQVVQPCCHHRAYE